MGVMMGVASNCSSEPGSAVDLVRSQTAAKKCQDGNTSACSESVHGNTSLMKSLLKSNQLIQVGGPHL